MINTLPGALLSPLSGKANRRLNTQPDFMESGEAYSLKNSPLTGDKKCGGGISIETF